jgi:glucosamine--fructose-6-phosphate aminotransferase (isomerizing)
MTTGDPPTPLLAPDSPLSAGERALVEELFAAEARLMDNLPTDDPADAKRRRRVELTRPEILAQPDAIRATLAAEAGAIEAAAAALAEMPPQRIILTGCGDSLAVMIGARHFLERLLGIPAEPVQALDFAYYGADTIGPGTLVVTLSSSGATTRTVEAMLVGRHRGARTLALSNTPGSPLMAHSDAGLRVHAERKGWPTQSSTAAMALLMQFAVALARLTGRDGRAVDAAEASLAAVPDLVATVAAATETAVRRIAGAEAGGHVYHFAGGGPSFAAALFGAAKVKECTPDHGVAVGQEEFHHYNSLKAGEPLFVVAPAGPSVPRARDTAFEGRRWGGTVYAVVSEEETALDRDAAAVIRLPRTAETVSPFLTAVPLQLFAYHLAMAKFAAAA